MRNVLLGLAAATACASVPAGAAPAIEALPGVIGQTKGDRACYLRVYDAAHLAANPRQRTTSLRVSFRRESWQDAAPEAGSQNRIRIEAARRGVKEPLRAIGDCRYRADANQDVQGRRRIRSAPVAPGIVCSIKGDATDEESGTEPVLFVSGNVLTIHMQDSLPMRRNRQLSDGPSQEIAFAGADAVFRLQRIADRDCDALDAAIVVE